MIRKISPAKIGSAATKIRDSFASRYTASTIPHQHQRSSRHQRKHHIEHILYLFDIICRPGDEGRGADFSKLIHRIMLDFHKQLSPDVSPKSKGRFGSEKAFAIVIKIARSEQATIHTPVFRIYVISELTMPTSTTSAIKVGKYSSSRLPSSVKSATKITCSL